MILRIPIQGLFHDIWTRLYTSHAWHSQGRYYVSSAALGLGHISGIALASTERQFNPGMSR